MPVDNALIHADSAPLLCAESEPQAPRKRAESEPSIMLNRHPPKPVVLAFSTFPLNEYKSLAFCGKTGIWDASTTCSQRLARRLHLHALTVLHHVA